MYILYILKMQIDSPDAFKLWLASELAPLSDANPDSLAKYVHALVKKDKPLDELKDLMIDQLDVFLREETKGFVQLIFKNLESKEYLSFQKEPESKEENEEKKEEPTSTAEVTPAPVAAPVPVEPPAVVPVIKDPELVTTTVATDRLNQIQSSVVSDRLNQIQSSVVSDSTPREEPVKPEKKKEEERDERFRLNRSRLKRNDFRSRSRSLDRVRRSRSRERMERIDLRERLGMRDREIRDREPRDRTDMREIRVIREIRDREQRERDRRERPPGSYRNKSPPLRRYERKRSVASRSPSPARCRSRSPKYSRFRCRNRSPGSQSRSRSRESPRSVRSYELLREELLAGTNRPNANFPGRRCRDYDVRGFCMQGELCPYDHGNDPVIMADLAVQYGPPPAIPGGPPLNLPPPAIMSALPPGGPPLIPPPSILMCPPPNMEYNPSTPSLNTNSSWSRPGPFHHGPRHMHPGGPGFHAQSRELINIPMDSHRDYQNSRHPDKRAGFDPRSQSGSCSLEIRRIPIGINNITHLNNHFAKFGKIVNIQVNYSNDPEAAIVTFSSPAEASVAYKSTEAVLNNRFIQVVWHNDGTGNNVKDRLGPQVHSVHRQSVAQPTPPGTDNIAVNTATCLIKKPTVAVDPLKRDTAEDLKAKEIAEIKANQELLEKNQILRKKTESTRKEVQELNTELRKRSQALLEKHIAEQKELLKKLMSPELDEKQRAALKNAMMTLQKHIEKVKAELVLPAVKKLPARKTKDEIQKEILDTELDIFSKQQEGGDLMPLYKKLTALKIELNKLQPFLAAPGPRLVRPTMFQVRHPMYGTHSGHISLVRKHATTAAAKPMYRPTTPLTDHRPTKLLVSGYENDEKDLVLAHFREFGEIADYIADDSTPSIVLNFKTRQEAEIAMNQGKNFQDRVLTVTWFSTPQLPARRRNSSASAPSYHMHAGRQVLLSGSDSDQISDNGFLNKVSDLEDVEERALDSSEELLLQDDDEDAEEERDDRSWRR